MLQYSDNIPISTFQFFIGIYGHSAVLDSSTNNILVFGGIVFSDEKIHESNALYAFNILKFTWNLLQPHDQTVIFFIAFY